MAQRMDTNVRALIRALNLPNLEDPTAMIFQVSVSQATLQHQR